MKKQPKRLKHTKLKMYIWSNKNLMHVFFISLKESPRRQARLLSPILNTGFRKIQK
jgi:hypothetical protein